MGYEGCLTIMKSFLDIGISIRMKSRQLINSPFINTVCSKTQSDRHQ